MKFAAITLLCIFVLRCNAEPIARPEAPDRPSRRRPCRRIYNPVCGSDGVTYSNRCVFKNAHRTNVDLTLASEGPCQEVAFVCPDFCIESYAPVCGSDGKTYSNGCFLGIAQCKNTDLTQAGEGACPDTREKLAAKRTSGCLDICMTLFDPVCGSDGITHSNRCELEKASCLQNIRIDIASEGRCEDCNTPCPLNYLPVCGSDGVLYSNECLFNAQKCRDSTLAKGTDCFN